MGESTRIVYDGFPELTGGTMMDKKKQLTQQYDYLREALMLEPRGHRDMFGAVLTSLYMTRRTMELYSWTAAAA